MLLLYQLIAKGLSFIARGLFRQAGQTWPGEIILKLNPHIARQLQPYFTQVILVLGTNGKTTTTKFIVAALERANRKVIYNSSGANLLNGIVSSILIQLPLFNKKRDYFGVFEVDEYAFPEISRSFNPNYLIILNVYRDQLDRYGEVGNILNRWQQSLQSLPDTRVIYLASDPALTNMISRIDKTKTLPYIVPQALINHQESRIFGDYSYCEKCSSKLSYAGYYLGHIGNWHCPQCGFKPPESAFQFSATELKKLAHLPDFSAINLESVYLLLQELKLNPTVFWKTLTSWKPAFGRGESISKSGRQYFFYLGKNPASWSAATQNLHPKASINSALVLGLNNRVPDGHDVSWIWDAEVDLKNKPFRTIVVYGDRAYDLAQRLKIIGCAVDKIIINHKQLRIYLSRLSAKEIYFLTNYSAMLDVRKLITGWAIL